MRIAIAADHAGFVLKEKLRRALAAEGHQVAAKAGRRTQHG